MPNSEEHEDGKTPRRLTAEEEEAMTNRLYRHAVENRARQLEELEKRFYPTAEPKRVPQETITQAIQRQEEFEARRRQNREPQGEGAQGKKEEAKISHEELESCVQRLYTDSIEKKQTTLRQLRERYDPQKTAGGASAKSKHMSKDALKESVTRMAVPSKREYTIDEINKIYGLS